MAGWHLLEKVIDKLGRHSTLTGKYWFLRSGFYLARIQKNIQKTKMDNIK